MSRVHVLAALLLLSSALAAAADATPLRGGSAVAEAAPSLRLSAPQATIRFDGTQAKSAPATDERRTQVGTVRAAPKTVAPLSWQAVEGGFAARFDVASEGALGLRLRLDLEGVGEMELRARGTQGRVESMRIPAGAKLAWGPWTEGAVQAVEVFAAEMPPPGAVKPGAVVHFDQPLNAKAAGECTIDTACSTGNAALDAAIAERRKSVARINFVDGGKSFVCTGTLVETEKAPAPYFLTANHCVGRAEVAASVASLWFYDAAGCGTGTAAPDSRQVAGGMSIDFADPNTDHTLLLMNAPPPQGAVFSGWNAARLALGASMVSISHPAGDVSKWAQATVSGSTRFPDWEQAAWLTTFARGIVQGGSSGSGLFEFTGGTLRLRAILSATTINENGPLSCTNLGQLGIYNRLDVFHPQVARRLMANPPPVTDDHGNRPSEATPVVAGPAETTVAGRIDYDGDVDVFRITVPVAGTLVARAAGGMDTVGVLLDANGERITSNDDAQTSALDFGITRRVTAGTYYLVVTHWESAGTGPYSVAISLAGVTANYTDLWWNPDEPGWGINLNHQGSKIFATLFTYEAGGGPLWLVMSDGALQPDGSYRGALLRTTGPVFNASPWGAVADRQVGTMRLSFPAAERVRIDYDVDGAPVTKEVERQRFSPRSTTCAWSAFDRTFSTNYQDLWWNPAEPGWGINVAHQGDTLFATLFTYGPDGRGAWYAMSDGRRAAGTRSFSGTLYRTTGPAFNAAPWIAATATPIGTMRLTFRDGNAGTLDYDVAGVVVTKPIQRQVFASPATECFDGD